MAIRSSASQEVRRLVADLESTDPDNEVRREAALARLAIIGTRAVRQILESLVGATDTGVRERLLLALEPIPDPRTIDPVLAALHDPAPAVRIAAARAGRQLLSLPRGTEVLDALTTIVLEANQPVPFRLAALDALGALPARTVRPLLDRLREDPCDELRRAASRSGAPPEDPLGELEEVSDGWGPRDADAVLQVVARAGGDAPLSTLHRLIEKVRSRETEGRIGRQRDWSSVRGALHLAVARRGSTVALYDLREALEEAREPLPLDYLSALSLVGDESCLEPLAVAYVQAGTMADGEHWRKRVGEAFREIVARLKLTRRSGPIRRLQARFRDEIAELLV